MTSTDDFTLDILRKRADDSLRSLGNELRTLNTKDVRIVIGTVHSIAELATKRQVEVKLQNRYHNVRVAGGITLAVGDSVPVLLNRDTIESSWVLGGSIKNASGTYIDPLHNLLGSQHTDTVNTSGTSGAIIYANGSSPPLWDSLGIGTSGTYLKSDGGLPSWATLSLGDIPAHNLLSATHGDAVVNAVTQGDLIIGNATPKWDVLSIGASGTYLKSNGGLPYWTTISHAELTGLENDEHPQYALLAGRSGGQTLYGGVDASDDLTFESTFHATKGSIIVNDTLVALGQVDIEGYVAIGNGSALDVNTTLVIDRDWTNATGEAKQLLVRGIITQQAASNVGHTILNPDGTVIDGVTSVHVNSVRIKEPTISLINGGLVTHAATVRITGAPTEGGTTNLAFWVDAGPSGFDDEVGFGTVNPTLPVDVKEKVGMSDIGGVAIKLTNKTGGVTVQGQLVKADTATNDGVILAAAGDTECIGIFLEAGVADGSEAWVVVGGIADVLFDDNVGPTRGDWVSTGVLAGYAAVATSPAAAPTHFEEIGHCIETVAAGGGGTHVLGRCVLHFN